MFEREDERGPSIDPLYIYISIYLYIYIGEPDDSSTTCTSRYLSTNQHPPLSTPQ
ncbi:hypothetical protein O3M35_003130 [Rhynocoris fuscipes]|uniref:Uncharacterized protein n=1 Tax=Rhynocoris fuscipes TaxID=488301 RepID=A0AAW1CNY7_9HEMI